MSEHRVPGDDVLGQLLTEGLGRAAGGPVDGGELLAGARRGAARIRRRRRTVLTVASVLVIGSPVGLAASEMMRPSSEAMPASGRAFDAAGGAPATANAEPNAASNAETNVAGQAEPNAETNAEPNAASNAETNVAGQPAPVPPAPAVALAVPDAALLTAADVPAPVFGQISDTPYPGPVPAASAVDTCGVALTTAPAAFGRVRVFERRPESSTATRWRLSSTVRVFAEDGARRYAAAASGLGCVVAVAVPGVDEAVVGHGPPDPQGRTHWYAQALLGRVVTEVRFVVPSGSGITRADVVRVLNSAAAKATSSGLVNSAAANPALG